MKYSFCETAAASVFSKWHIRRLTANGQKFGGGIDTAPLCNTPVKFGGWDIDVELTEFHLEENACKNCLAEYRKATSEQTS